MFRRKPKEPAMPAEWLIVGLGNPGPEYKGTRHNVGFDLIELLARRHGIKVDRAKNRALTGSGTIDGRGVILARPLTYMNLSGQAVAPIAKANGIKPEKVLVIADDLDLPAAKLRLKKEGGAGGHNGHKSIISSLGSQAYPRVKIGIGHPGNAIDHVLSKFTPDERIDINDALEATADACELILSEDWDAALRRLDTHNKAQGSAEE